MMNKSIKSLAVSSLLLTNFSYASFDEEAARNDAEAQATTISQPSSNYSIVDAIKDFKAKCDPDDISDLPNPVEEDRDVIQKNIGFVLPNDLWEFYKECSNLNAYGIDIYSVCGNDPLIKPINDRLHQQDKALREAIAFSSDERGNYYTLMPGNGVRFWQTVEGQFSDDSSDRWPSLAEWLKEKLDY